MCKRANFNIFPLKQMTLFTSETFLGRVTFAKKVRNQDFVDHMYESRYGTVQKSGKPRHLSLLYVSRRNVPRAPAVFLNTWPVLAFAHLDWYRSRNRRTHGEGGNVRYCFVLAQTLSWLKSIYLHKWARKDGRYDSSEIMPTPPCTSCTSVCSVCCRARSCSCSQNGVWRVHPAADCCVLAGVELCCCRPGDLVCAYRSGDGKY